MKLQGVLEVMTTDDDSLNAAGETEQYGIVPLRDVARTDAARRAGSGLAGVRLDPRGPAGSLNLRSCGHRETAESRLACGPDDSADERGLLGSLVALCQGAGVAVRMVDRRSRRSRIEARRWVRRVQATAELSGCLLVPRARGAKERSDTEVRESGPASVRSGSTGALRSSRGSFGR